MRVKPGDSLHPKIIQSPAAAAAAASVTAAYALAKPEILGFADKEDPNSKVILVDTSQQDISVEINSIREEKKALERSLVELTTESSALKTKIEEVNGSYAELSKVWFPELIVEFFGIRLDQQSYHLHGLVSGITFSARTTCF